MTSEINRNNNVRWLWKGKQSGTRILDLQTDAFKALKVKKIFTLKMHHENKRFSIKEICKLYYVSAKMLYRHSNKD